MISGGRRRAAHLVPQARAARRGERDAGAARRGGVRKRECGDDEQDQAQAASARRNGERIIGHLPWNANNDAVSARGAPELPFSRRSGQPADDVKLGHEAHERRGVGPAVRAERDRAPTENPGRVERRDHEVRFATAGPDVETRGPNRHVATA